MRANPDDVKRILAELAVMLEQLQHHRDQMLIRHAMRQLERLLPRQDRS